MTEDAVGTTTASAIDWTALRAVLVRAVRRQCPSWLSDAADDLVQAAIVKVMAMPGVSEGNRTLSSFYLHRVAHSALIDEIRRRQRRREVALEVDANESGEWSEGVAPPRAVGDPERSASARELGAAIRESLLEMAEDRRLAVALYLQGHSVPDAARLLGWPAKRTENLVYRGLADLRQRLLAKGHQP